MLPPPEASYSSVHEMLRSINAFAHSQGYVVTKRRSDLRRNTITFHCDRGGTRNISSTPADTEHRRRTSSRLIHCPFKLYTQQLKVDGLWHLTVRNPDHNHEASANLSGHPVVRRLQPEQRAVTTQLITAGVPPKDILTVLQQESPSISITARDIYNEHVRVRQAALLDRPPILALMDELQNSNHRFAYLCNGNNEVTRLFFAHPGCVELALKHPYTLLMDCTYKTNRFRMPMLHIIGVIACNTSFTVAVAFIREETEMYYRWALEQLAEFYDEMQPLTITIDRELALMTALPATFLTSAHLLCVWHINKNILANCRKYFGPTEDWDTFFQQWTNVV